MKTDGKSLAPGFAWGLIVGLAFGAAIWFLFSSRRGKETRELITEKAANISETLKELTANREKVYRETWKKRRGQPKISEAYFK